MARAISKNQVSDPGPSWPSCFIQFHLLLIHRHHVRHIPRYFIQCNFASIDGVGSKNCVIIIISCQSESLLHSVKKFIIVLTKTEYMFQRDSNIKCAFWVGIINDVLFLYSNRRFPLPHQLLYPCTTIGLILVIWKNRPDILTTRAL